MVTEGSLVKGPWPELAVHDPRRKTPAPPSAPEMPEAEVEAEPVVEAEIVEDDVRPHRPLAVASLRLDEKLPAGQTALRHGYWLASGLGSWTRRGFDAATLGVYRRQIRAADASGDREALALWTERRERAAAQRHRWWMDLPKLSGGALAAVLGFAVLVLVLGLLAQLSGAGRFVGVVHGVGTGVRVLFAVLGHLRMPVLVLGPVLLVLAAWREGRRRARPPSWLRTAADADADVTIDETTIARALDALRIPQIRDYLKAGAPLQFIVSWRTDGRGGRAVIRLPAGVTAETIARRRAQLATGLYRAATEVWPRTGAEAGILDLWVADKGALAEGAGPYPLLTSGTVDVFKGVPGGRLLRGDPVIVPLMERNTICGGAPGQGKSTAARTIMAGVALDPTAELRIWVPDTNFDFEAFKPRCSRYVMGAEDERIAEILADLHRLAAEVQDRGELLVRYRIPAVNRQIASKGVGLHPLFCLLEEAHVAIQHKDYGKEISQLLIDIVKLGRKRGIHMLVSTQAPTKDSMPRDVTRNCSNGIAFYVGDHVPNDALLGQGAYRAGHRATDLIPGVDRGTAVCKGFSGERSDIVQWYFLDVSHENDQVTPIIARSLAAIEQRGALPGAGQPAIETRDLLADVTAVLKDEPVPAAELPALLRQLAPSWPAYQSLNGVGLRKQLDDRYGYKVPSTGNRWPVDPAAVRALLADRELGPDEAGE